MDDTITAPPDIDLEFVVMDEAELEKPYRVIIHNDDVTPMDFVVAVLVKFFELDVRRATRIMLEAHTSGQALVAILPYEEAHRRVYAAQSAARDFGYPLSFTLEPD
ncbi:MAG: ATP-dependent Clp protease adaptor ClpS [Caldilineae bacterium]|nr:MAG: ATP-dependent Clp protease adaptor ClpS [Caldilineae bacterium]